MNDSPAVVAFVAARSGAGKTTLVEKVVACLKGRGFRVGTVKHSGHRARFDREGTDSWRYSRAGADVSVLAAPDMLAVVRMVQHPTLADAVAQASVDTDIVLVEGFKDLPVPKIEVHRSGHCEALYCHGRDGADPCLVAVASDIPVDVDVPLLNLNDPEEVCSFIIVNFLKER